MSLLSLLTSVSTQGTRQPHATQVLPWQSMLQTCPLTQRQGGSGRGASKHTMPSLHTEPNGMVQEAHCAVCHS